jgi:hypothetical protein
MPLLHSYTAPNLGDQMKRKDIVPQIQAIADHLENAQDLDCNDYKACHEFCWLRDHDLPRVAL